MTLRLAFLLASAPALVACNNAVTVELQTGEQTFDLTASSLMLPTELQDGAVIRSIDCSMTGICPSTPEIAVVCDMTTTLCDPAPHTIAVPVGEVVDFDALLSDARTVLRFVDEIQIVEVLYRADNRLTIPLPEILVYWGPESAADITAPGVALLGTIPGVGPDALLDGTMTIDAAGAAAMSDYVVNVDRRIRFFAETQVDLAPGSPFPAGSAALATNIRVRAIGRIID